MTMSVSRLFKKALIDEDMTQKQFASLIDKDVQQVRNALYRDSFNFNSAEKWFDALGYEIVIRNKQTGRIID